MARRVGLGALAVVVVLALVGLVVCERYWPHHRPGLADGERYGVDVSNHQGVIEWEAMAAEVVLYGLDDWDDLYPTRERNDRERWSRRTGPLRPDGPWTMGQFTGEARVDGVDGPVDLDVVRL